MKTTTDLIINQCIAALDNQIEFAERISLLPFELLNKRPSPANWSALECFEHISLYSDFYNPSIKKAITQSSTKPVKDYKSGWLGEYFVNTMLPKGKLNKMSTFKDKNPIYTTLDASAISRFIANQEELKRLILSAKSIDIGKTRCPISIAKGIRLKLGDVFRFLINHNTRHINQIKRIIE
jgi:hypothetical protein